MKPNILLMFLFVLLSLGLTGQEESEDYLRLSSREMTVNLPFIGQQTITVYQDGADLLFEGDIVIGDPSGSGRGGAVISRSSDDEYLWPNGVIPFVIADSHPKEQDILDAINELNASTNLCVRPRTNETDYIEIVYQAGKCGSSPVGRQGGKQTVKVGNRCGNTKGSTMHEILHSAGFWHEQSRSDRDRYVEIILANVNVTSSSDPRHNFNKYSRGTDIGDYNYGSIMHYGQHAFAKPDPSNPGRRLVTIRPKRSGVSIGQRSALNSGDVSSINDIYPTQASGCDQSFASTGRGGSQGNSSSGNNASDPNSSNTRWNVGNNQSFDIRFDVELVPQQTGMSCWAAGAAMLVGWRDRVSIDPSEIARGIGYWGAYQTGLNANDTTMFNHWGLVHEPPQSYTVQGFVDLLAAYGPLWVATHEGGPHVRVISGIRGDGTPDGTILTIFDPWQRGMRNFRMPNPGSTYTETYTEFVRKQHELANREMSEPAPIYVAHN